MQAVTSMLEDHVRRGALPGAVALVARGEVVELAVAGQQDVRAGTPMRRDTIFRIASMTKPVAAAAAMLLVEEGRIGLQDPVERWLPELADRRVLRTPESPLDDTVAAERPITLDDLLTFRLGIGFVMAPTLGAEMARLGVAPGPGQLAFGPAAMIVIGGTAGACMLQFPLSIFIAACKSIVKVFLHKGADGEAIVQQIVGFANKARKSGIVSLDADLLTIEDPFLKQALGLAVDGTEASEVRKIMELELENKSEIEEKIPAVFEAAGGYSPTVGIIGAVMGLIQVMKNLSDIDEVGRGIATAFVATIYGVAIANLICLPAAAKLKFRHREETMIKQMMLEGVISILEGMNPRMIETKLRTFIFEPHAAPEASGKAAAAEATA